MNTPSSKDVEAQEEKHQKNNLLMSFLNKMNSPDEKSDKKQRKTKQKDKEDKKESTEEIKSDAVLSSLALFVNEIYDDSCSSSSDMKDEVRPTQNDLTSYLNSLSADDSDLKKNIISRRHRVHLLLLLHEKH